MKEISRKEILEYLCKSSIYGNLGLFVGAGFSKAVLNDEGENRALSWDELLYSVSKRLLPNDKPKCFNVNKSCPEIATELCHKISETNSIDYNKATLIFKREIANQTAWIATQDKKTIYSPLLESISPKWIITTNYDLILESLLPGKSLSLNSDDKFVAPKDLIPIYHLHGSRIAPASIVITQEDYIKLFRPNVYRQYKLSLLMMESTMLFIGYSLGDSNVLTAIDWARNVFTIENKSQNPNYLIQLLWKRKPRREGYYFDDNIIVLETNDIEVFFEEFINLLNSCQQKHASQLKKIQKVIDKFKNPSDDFINNFISDNILRSKTIKIMLRFAPYFNSAIIEFLAICFNELWNRAKPRGAFEPYNDGIKIIMDFLVSIEPRKFPTVILEYLAETLDSFGYFVGPRKGASFSAYETWESRKNDIPIKTIKELNQYAQQNSLRIVSGMTKALLEYAEPIAEG